MKPKQYILGSVSSVMRQATLILLREHAQSLTHAKSLLPKSRRQELVDTFTIAHDLPVAFGLVEQIRGRRRRRRARNDGRHIEWYGFHRQAKQSREQSRDAEERRLLAKRLVRPMGSRLAELRDPMVLAAAKKVMKHGASGGCEFHVRSGDEPDYHVELTKDWRRVNKGKDTWASSRDAHHISVSRAWLGVHRRIGDGTAVIDGRFFLDARVFLEAGERRVWEAQLVRTGRGFQAVVEGVWLSAYGRDVTVHANLKKALSAPPPEGSPVQHCEDEEFLAQLVA